MLKPIVRFRAWALVWCMAATAHAAGLFQPFDVPSGTGLAGTDPNAGAAHGFTGTWAATSAGDMDVAAGSLAILNDASGVANRAERSRSGGSSGLKLNLQASLADPVSTTSGTLYVSFKFRANWTAGADQIGIQLLTGASPSTAGSGTAAYSIGTNSANNAFRVAGSTQATSTTSSDGQAFANDATWFFVGKIEMAAGSDTMRFNIYRDAANIPAAEPASFTLNQSATNDGAIDAIRLYSNNGANEDVTLAIDDLRLGASWSEVSTVAPPPPAPPNILVIILDDWGTGDSGTEGAPSGFLSTPAMDRIASEGVRFSNAVCAAPSCAPSRAALLTGRNPWQLEEAANLTGLFPAKYTTYVDAFESAGYAVGYTGKGWGPGAPDAASGRPRNPAGPAWNTRSTSARWTTGCSFTNYWKNFEDFLASRSSGQPFCFWVGINEPHRSYQAGTGTAALPPPVGDPLYNSNAIANPPQPAKLLADAQVPPWLPQHDTVRADVMDYAREVEYADYQISQILNLLDAQGLANDTLVVLCTDNGRPFARQKQNVYQAGIRSPLFVRWPAGIANPGRTVTDHVSLIDLAPTFYELAGIAAPIPVTGSSLVQLLESPAAGRIDPSRDSAIAGMERHGYARPDDVGYPMRALRTDTHLYIRNFKPDRYPAGNPTNNFYTDIDNGPAKDFLIDNLASYPTEAALCLGFRPAEELYDIVADPDCLNNLAAIPEQAATLESLREELDQRLRNQGDPRVLGYGDLFDGYARYANPNWNQGGTFKPDGSGTPNAAYIDAGMATLLGDTDADGLADMAEHFFGTRHDLPNGSPLSNLQINGNALEFEFPANRSQMSFAATPVGSPDLSPASWSSEGATIELVTPGQPVEVRRARIPFAEGQTRGFGRLEITTQP